ncbi:nitroreductase [Bradyrhizobium sp. i1.3.6]
MSAPEAAMIGEGAAVQSGIDEIIAGRFACRDFSGAPVGRGTIEQILRVARFAPSGANIQPWHVYVLAGDAKDRVSVALREAHETARDAHMSEYRYYASDLPEPYLQRRQEFGRLFYGSLGIAQTDIKARSGQTAKNYAFFGAPVALIVTIDRRLEVGSWLDLGMFIQNVLLAAAGHGLQVMSAGDVLEIPPDPASAAVDPGGANGRVRHFDRPCQAPNRGQADAARGHRGLRLVRGL